MYKRLILSAALILAFSTSQAEPTSGPQASYDSQIFLQLNHDAQKIYVAGVMDGFSYVSYSHGFAAYDVIARCIKSKPAEDLTISVVDWLKSHPDFNEGLTSAVIQTISTYCA